MNLKTAYFFLEQDISFHLFNEKFKNPDSRTQLSGQMLAGFPKPLKKMCAYRCTQKIDISVFVRLLMSENIV